MVIWADGGEVIKRDDLEERESENGREGKGCQGEERWERLLGMCS